MDSKTKKNPGPPKPTVQDLLEQDSFEVPEVLASSSRVDLGTEKIPKERYTDADFAKSEFEHVWKHAWQMACREEDIPDKGDVLVYDIGDTSLLIARQADGAIKAFFNACLHRGRRLCEDDRRVVHFRCPFHGFSWHLDGSLRKVTNAWDFDHVDPDAFQLPQAHVALWGGFVFVSVSDAPEPFFDYLEGLDRDYETRGWDLADRRKTVWARKRYNANWKVVQEAFIESFHVVATHPSVMSYIGDAHTQYDVWPDRRHVTRMIAPRGIQSPHIKPLSEEAVYRAGVAMLDAEAAEKATLPEGQSARAATAADRRNMLRDLLGIETDGVSDSELIDTIQYHLFPNLVMWAGYGGFIVYRFLPDGDDPDYSLMDIFFLVPESDETPRTVARQPTFVDVDESHHKAADLGGYCDVFDEDMSNIGEIQKGLKTMRGEGVTLGAYQEMRIRRFHQTLTEYIDRGSAKNE